MRYDLWQGAREKAETLEGGLKMLLEDAAGKAILKLWKPKATKPYAHYAFKTREEALKYAQTAVENQKAWLAEKAKRKAARAVTPELLASFDVGDIFYATWGYDQTNVDFYQIVARRGSMALLKKVEAKSEGLTGNGMADYCTPVKDAFLDDERYPAEWKRVVNSSGSVEFKMKSYAYASKWEGRKVYRSWDA